MKEVVINPLIVQMLCDTVCRDKCFDQVNEIIERKGRELLFGGAEVDKMKGDVANVTKSMRDITLSGKCSKSVATAAEGGAPSSEDRCSDDVIFNEYLKYANVYTPQK